MSLYIGVMSGTSLDGVDVAIVNFAPSGECELIAADTYVFSPLLHKKLFELISIPYCHLSLLGQLNIELGNFIALCVNDLLAISTISSSSIKAIGSHGQTIFHEPDSSLPFSMQIGDPNVIAQITGITTIADFRQRDIAAGGQGAPLVPAFHQALFTSIVEDSAIINIGGMSNLTLLPCDKSDVVIGFDTGPGNALMDSWISKHQDQPYDKNGDWAKSGQVNNSLLTALLDEPYFNKAIPKSTGRELFNLNWLQAKIQQIDQNISPADVQATLLMLTAHSITHAIQKHCPQVNALYICGGGSHNKTLVETLARLQPKMTVATTEILGLHPDWVEACAFAWLAHKNIQRESANITSVTGANSPVILGATYWSNDNS